MGDEMLRAYEFGRKSQEFWFEQYLPGKKLAAFIILGLIFVIVAMGVKLGKCSEPFGTSDMNPLRVYKESTEMAKEIVSQNPQIIERHNELRELATRRRNSLPNGTDAY